MHVCVGVVTCDVAAGGASAAQLEAELERLGATAAMAPAVMPSPPRGIATAAADDDGALAAALAELEQLKAEAATYAARVREEREAAAARLKAANDKVAALEKELAKISLKVYTFPALGERLFVALSFVWWKVALCE